jgi:hypothetical protein
MIAESPAAVDKGSTDQASGVAPSKKSRRLASWFGVFLFLYAIAHASPGMAAVGHSRLEFVQWAASAGWVIATGSLILASYGLWGFPGLAKRWRAFAMLGVAASLALLIGTAQWPMWPLMVLDGLIASIAIDSNPVVVAKRKRGIVKWTVLQVGRLLAVSVWIYVVSVIALRPIQQHWGASQAEMARVMPGDDRQASRSQLIDHVVSVNAVPEKVWPWIAQIGQGKAGFYSYDWLERVLGMPIHNTYAINPDWQHVQVGDYVRTYPNRNAAMWRVGAVEPNRLMYLEGWGPFWLQPTANGKTRFGIRTDPGKLAFHDGPIQVFVFEPIHFLMEEKMLRTIKHLAEHP